MNGHSHRHRISPVTGGNGTGGFWQVTTASHIDWPQQSRLLEVMDNRNGTLSIFGTILDAAAPAAAPAPGPASAFSTGELVSLGRALSYNDPQRLADEGGGQERDKLGAAGDRNVELLVRDPR